MITRAPLFFISSIAALACGLVAVVLSGNGVAVRPLLERLSASGGIDSNYVYMLSALPAMAWLFGALAVGFIALVLVPAHIWQRSSKWFRALSLMQVTVAVGIVSLILNLILMATVPYQLWDDYAIYHRMAIDLMEGRGVQQGWLESGRASAFWAVGYPALLAPFYALFGAAVWVGQGVNALLRIITVVLTGQLTRHLWGKNVAKIAVILIGFFPGLLFHTLTLGYNLALITLYLAVAYLVLTASVFTWRRTVLLGITLAALVYVRPIFLFVPVLIAMVWAIQGKPLRQVFVHSLVVTVTMGVLLTPWLWRGYHLFGEWVPMYTNGGVNLFIGNNPQATGGYYSAPAFARTEVLPMSEVERDHYFRGLALTWIRTNPGTFATNALKKAVLILMRDDQAVSFATKQRYAERPAALLLAFVLLSNLYYDAVMLLAAGYTLYAIVTGQHRRTLLVLGMFVAYVVGVYMLFFGMDHYKVPLVFVPVLVAALAIRTLICGAITGSAVAPALSLQERSGESLF